MLHINRAHAKALLVSFDTENDSQSHVDALTREVQGLFKRLDKDIREFDQGISKGEDAAVCKQVKAQLAGVSVDH